MLTKKIIGTAILFLAVTFSIQAQNADNRWAFGAGLNVFDNSTERDFGPKVEDYFGASDHSYGFRASAMYYIGGGFSAGLKGAFKTTMTGQDSNPDVSDFTMYNGLAVFQYALKGGDNDGWFDPYLSGDLGVTRWGGKSGFSYGLGGGVNFWFSDRFGLNVDSAWNMADVIPNGAVQPLENTVFSKLYFQHSLGLAYRFGKARDTDGDGVADKDDQCPEEAGPAENNGCPWGDTDADGVNNNDDMCPNEYGYAANNGCPWPDADGDGVADKDDACPDQPGPAENNGCPWPDTDGDGILDKDDPCPTEMGPNGCPDKDVLSGVPTTSLFGLESATLSQESKNQLDVIAEKMMAASADYKYNINGYTDTTGPESYNLKLSQDRADAVKAYLVSKGVSEESLVATGFGESNPSESNDSRPGREQNRRVEIIQE